MLHRFLVHIFGVGHLSFRERDGQTNMDKAYHLLQLTAPSDVFNIWTGCLWSLGPKDQVPISSWVDWGSSSTEVQSKTPTYNRKQRASKASTDNQASKSPAKWISKMWILDNFLVYRKLAGHMVLALLLPSSCCRLAEATDICAS